MPKRQILRPGTIFSVPIADEVFAFGRLTPQYAVAEFFLVKSHRQLGSAALREFATFRFGWMLPNNGFSSRRWLAYDYCEWPSSGFDVTTYRIGNQIACGTKIIKGFIHTTSTSVRPASEREMTTVTPMSVANEAMVLACLEKALADAPAI